MQLRILNYNIKRGGTGREKALAAVINAVAPDAVILQEATRPEVIARLARATQMVTSESRRGRSLGFLSRLPIASATWIRPRWSQHAFLELTLANINLRIIGVHLSAVHASWTEARRVRELRALLTAIKQSDAVPHLLVGDFNTLAPDERLDVGKLPARLRLLWLSGGRIRWQTIGIMLGAGYADAYRLRHAADAGYTFPTWDPHVRLDYAFLPKAMTSLLVSCDVVTDGDVREASDHFPLRSILDLDA